jgi:D-amino-acid dehydrogenase
MTGPAIRADAVVLGAGIVGICVALHLQKRGRSVALVDRRGAAEETSFGNAGLIQREGVYPYGFPHDFGALVRYSFNRTIDAHYHPSAILRIAPFLWKYWHFSRPARHEKIAHVYAKLIEHCVTEHDALAAEAGAEGFMKRAGWMKVFRTERERDTRFAEAARWKAEYGLNFRTLDRDQLEEEEPHLAPVLVGAFMDRSRFRRRSAGARPRLPGAFRVARRALPAGQRREPREDFVGMERAHR